MALTYAKFKEAWDKLQEYKTEESYTISMTHEEMREKGYSEDQVYRITETRVFEMPDDREKFDMWYQKFVNSLKK